MVDHDERLQLDRAGSTSPVDSREQSQLQLDLAQPAARLSAALLQLDRLQLDRV
jgi:hypothetical protein